MKNMACVADSYKFNLNHLRSLLELAEKKEFQDVFFDREIKASNKYILWRHDVDIDLDAAIEMAKLEAEVGIKSTYFLMTRGVFYNLFTIRGQNTVKKLLELGHQIGLHCYLNIGRTQHVSQEYIEREVHRDFAILDNFFGEGNFRRIVSFHNPPQSFLGLKFSSFLSASEERFFKEIKYLSDSNANWREGPLENWLEAARYSQFSIVLHPIIWVYGGSSIQEIIKKFYKARTETLIQDLQNDFELPLDSVLH